MAEEKSITAITLERVAAEIRAPLEARIAALEARIAALEKALTKAESLINAVSGPAITYGLGQEVKELRAEIRAAKGDSRG